MKEKRGGKRRSAGRWALVFSAMASIALVPFMAPEPPLVPDADRSLMESQVAAKIQTTRERVFDAPDSHIAWGELGVVFQAHGLDEEAARCYEKAIELSPSSFRWRYLLVHALGGFDRDAALNASARALELRSDYPALLLVRAEQIEEVSPPEEVAELYRKALALAPASAAAELGLGRLAMASDDLAGARRHLERAAQLSPDAGAVRATLARLYQRLGENERAIEEAQAASLARESVAIVDPIHFRMTRESVSSTAQLQRARDFEEKGELEKAVTIYRDLVALRPDDADMRVRLGDALSFQGERGEAKEHYRKALAIKADLAPAHFGLAMALSREGAYEEAAGHFQTSLSIRPRHAASHVALASTLAHEGRVAEALAHYRKALELAPGDVAAHRALAELLLRQRRYRDAAVHYRAVVEKLPDSGAVRLQLGACLAMTGEYDRAFLHLERARALGQTIPEAVSRKVELGRSRKTK